MNTRARDLDPDHVRELVASNLSAELERQRWSGRKAATALGLTQAYVNRRTSGETELSASDLLLFSRFLDVPLDTFYAEHRHGPSAMRMAPTANDEGHLLPEMDSNHQPAGYTLDPETEAPDYQEIAYLSDRRRPASKPAATSPAVVSLFGKKSS